MHHPTFDVDVASILFNLPGYRVISASPALSDQLRQVFVEAVEAEGACPSCGVPSQMGGTTVRSPEDRLLEQLWGQHLRRLGRARAAQ